MASTAEDESGMANLVNILPSALTSTRHGETSIDRLRTATVTWIGTKEAQCLHQMIKYSIMKDMVRDQWTLHFGDAGSTQKTAKSGQVPHIKMFVDDFSPKKCFSTKKLFFRYQALI